VMAGLNSCGYDDGLASSDPVRQKIRQEINQALKKSEAARDSRDQLCAFIRTHSMNSQSLNLASYISLALFLSPPPALTPNVSNADLPPDAAPLIGMAPLLRKFSSDVDLHLIWALNRPAYNAEIVAAHKAMSKMLIQTDLYLKQPPPSYGPRRFIVILEPLIDPGQVNARVYGGDYIVVESPVNGKIDLKPVKHTYLRFVLEPLIYSRAKPIDRLTPILELVQTAPMPFEFKSDVLSLVTECMIRAIEAHTMDTGITPYKIPAHFDRSQAAAIDKAENQYESQVAEVRRKAVDADMVHGYILTRYFYNYLHGFAESSTSLQQIVGEMIYGMNADIEKSRVQHIVFAAPSKPAKVHPADATAALLDRGEKELFAGNAPQAAEIARQALADHTDTPGRAQFLLARAEIMQNQMEPARNAFQQAVKSSHDLRTIAWSHIYLGRLADLQGNRTEAVAEYKKALESRDGEPDTKQAAEAGLKAPFAPPGAAQEEKADQPSGAPGTGDTSPN
ncbi:MAG TPA: hypothetical protein VFL96_14470, partial [Acidobacteriaceae bacterium]|nr:hypothetical protein [Acidobacteriaceae bacterium]